MHALQTFHAELRLDNPKVALASSHLSRPHESFNRAAL